MIGDNAPGAYWQYTCLTAPRYTPSEPQPGGDAYRGNRTGRVGHSGSRGRMVEIAFPNRLIRRRGLIEAAKEANVERKTVARAIKSGRLSRLGFFARYLEEV
jgi:hypothetical protein